MKTKIVILVVATAIATLSFTFATVNNGNTKPSTVEKKSVDSPVGGFALVDKN